MDLDRSPRSQVLRAAVLLAVVLAGPPAAALAQAQDPSAPATPAPAPPASAPAPPAAATSAPAPEKPEELIEEVAAWINDDVVLWTELREQEQQQVAALLQESRRGGAAPEELSRKVQEVRDKTLMDLISQRLLVQEAERLYDLDQIKKDVVRRFKERQKIKTDEELDEQLAKWGMTRGELEDRLLQSAAPDMIIGLQVERHLGVSEQEAREYYEKHRDRFSSPGQVTFREIVLLAQDPERRAERRDEARAIAEKARGGTDFVELVRSSSEARSKALDGRIGPVLPGDLVPVIGSALLALQPGQVSEPIETGQGWHILRLEERKDARAPAFEEIRNEVENAVREEKYGPAIEAYLDRIWSGATIEVRRAYADRLPARWRQHVVVRN